MFAIGDKEWPGVSKVIEESAELLEVFGKLMGSNGETKHWTGDLRAKMIEEAADAIAAINFFMDHNLTAAEREQLEDRRLMKEQTFESWHAKTVAERLAKLKGCPISFHHYDCDCEGKAGDR